MGIADVRAAAAEQNPDPEPLYLEALGGRFQLGAGPDAITWLELAAAGDKSVRSLLGATAWLAFAKSCFTPTGWADFHAAVRAAGITDHAPLEDLVGDALAVITGRPTTPSSDSDSGSSSTSRPSTDTSSSETPEEEASSA